tara:strand:+ start:3136 stop:3630 length:495 start_codon:yes stop_codon:yes gene_type:complete
MTLESNLKNKIISLLLLCFPTVAYADPEINNELIPPGEAMYVTDSSILNQLNLGPDDEPVWCYSNLANSLIISSADREREKCSLQMSQQVEELTARHVFEIDTLNLEIKSLKKTTDEIIYLKDKEIEKLTAAALKRPNDYTLWWATGGFAAGIITTVSIFFLVK